MCLRPPWNWGLQTQKHILSVNVIPSPKLQASSTAFSLPHDRALHIACFPSRPTQLKCLLWQEVKSLSPHFSCTKLCGWSVHRVTGHGEVMQWSALLLLAAEIKATAFSLYLKETQGKKSFLLKLMCYYLSKLRGFNPKSIGKKEYIYSGKQSVMKPNTTFFRTLYLNAELFSGDPCPNGESISGLKGSPWMAHRAV